MDRFMIAAEDLQSRQIYQLGISNIHHLAKLIFDGVLNGLSDGVGAIISHNYGSRQLHRVKRR